MTQRACQKGRGIAAVCLATIGLTLTACAPRPTSPSVMALPARGESFAVFEQHETTCRQYATAQTGGQTPGQTAAMSGMGGAVLGSGLGAASGALLGSVSGHAGAGAAIGAGSGLLAGTLMGAMHGQQAAATTQRQYDMSYAQCMIANGEQIMGPTAPVVYAAPAPAFYAARPVYVVRPVYVPPPRVYVVP